MPSRRPARHRRPQLLLEAAAVLQPGQRVQAGLTLQFLHPLVAAPDQDQRAQQGGQRDADDGEQQGQADVRPVGVADDEHPGPVGDVDRRLRRVVEQPLGPDHRLTVDAELHVVGAGDRGDRRGGEVLDPEASDREAQQGGAALADGGGRGAVAVDRAVDVEAIAAEQEVDHRGRRGLAGIARVVQEGRPFGVGAEVEAERSLRPPLGDDVGEREVDRAAGGFAQMPAGPAFDDLDVVRAFEARPFGVRYPLDEPGRGQRALLHQRAGDDVELVLVEIPVGLEEGGGAGELADREVGDGFGLVRGARRLAALHLVEVGVVVGVDDQGRHHRAGGDQEDRDESDPETESHGALSANGA